MSARTPGPWTVRDIASRQRYIGPSNDGGAPSIAIVPDRGRQHEQAAAANARLIAAAPELLAALMKMVREFGYDAVHKNGLVHDEREAIMAAVAALAKATGEVA